MKKILIVFGTRPEAIKMAPIVKELEKIPNKFEVKVCVTAQHREMLDQVLYLFNIKPDFDLNIMKSGQDLYDITSKVLLGMREILYEIKPDLVLVHGDTSTSTAAALAAFYQQVPVGHIEAGLRTNEIYSPWPEEMNRQITSRIATFHFAPTSLSKQNLLKENIKEEKIFVTGNTVIDSLFWVLNKITADDNIKNEIKKKLIISGLPEKNINYWQKSSQFFDKEAYSNIKDYKSSSENLRKLILITGHRRENFGKGFVSICEAIYELSRKYQNVDFVYPMHLNPNVRSAITQVFGDIVKSPKRTNSNIFFIEPLEYLQFVTLMDLSYLILTDSGGIQEEAPSLGKPVLVMRETTERPEALDAGTVRLVGTNKIKIIDEVSELINNHNYYSNMRNIKNPYGDGKACKRIVEILK